MKVRKKFFFTFLEVIIAMSILMISGGAIGWKMYRLIDQRRFHSQLEQLHSRLLTCQRLALNMQCDWRGTLSQLKGKWFFEAKCLDPSVQKKIPPISLGSLSVFFKDESIDGFSIDFFSTGMVIPQGKLMFCQSFPNREKEQQSWDLPSIFQFEQGNEPKEMGPMHPNDL